MDQQCSEAGKTRWADVFWSIVGLVHSTMSPIRFAALASFCCLSQVNASLPIQVTGDNISQLPYTVTVKTSEGGGGFTFTVTIKRKKGDFSLLREGSLRVHEDAIPVLSCPVAEARDQGRLVYRFHVSSAFVAKCTFEFRELAFHKLEGNARLIPLPGSDIYWFFLKDVAALSKPEQKPPG